MKHKGRQKVDKTKAVVEIQPLIDIEISGNADNAALPVSSFSGEAALISISIEKDFTGSINGKKLDLKKGVHEIEAKYLAYYQEYAKAKING